MELEEFYTTVKFKTGKNFNVDLHGLSHNPRRNDKIINFLHQQIIFRPTIKILVLCKFISHIRYLSCYVKNSDYMCRKKNTYDQNKNILIWSGYAGHGAQLLSNFDLIFIAIPVTKIPLHIMLHINDDPRKIVYCIDENLISLSKFNEFNNYVHGICENYLQQ